MNKLSKKSLLLFISALALAAFAMPSLASAATFDGVGLHTLTSSNLAFTAGTPLNGGSSCASSTFEVDVTAARATITSGTFDSCSGVAGLAACGVASHTVATNLPWEVTPVAPDGIIIDGIHLVQTWTTGPCAGTVVTLAGNLAGGTVTNATHTITYAGGTGLTATAGGASATTTVTGDIRDDQGTLAVTP